MTSMSVGSPSPDIILVIKEKKYMNSFLKSQDIRTCKCRIVPSLRQWGRCYFSNTDYRCFYFIIGYDRIGSDHIIVSMYYVLTLEHKRILKIFFPAF